MGKVKKIIIWVVVILVLSNLASTMYFGYSAYWGPFKGLNTYKITNAYDAKTEQEEIIFYGASNFGRWTTMDDDLADYKVQNHAFGGSTDKDLVKYADRLLYPYNPKIVVFQTGSNDYVLMEGNDQEKIEKAMAYKKEMFEKFHEKLPDANFIVMSGLLLPGRSEYTEMTEEINRQLEELSSEYDYIHFVDASEMTYKDGNYNKSLFVEDEIHLNEKGQDIWKTDYIVPALEEVIKEKNLDSVRN
ncbi:GDSL-type esterase/lipase family protein [Terribacillus saccharophilus]|uniref:GDSL-type esterase/lipase family protein n=1 Tax=Terribacillus saccharophilus TaxID=361277 RepID=UPI003981CA10